jgi:fido (protein-threonine AMPylation protein)/DNA-binding CsgD family transcriptional regulator
MKGENMTNEEDRRLELISELEGYIRLGEPDRAEKAHVWKAAIGLQQTDGLDPSPYLIETAKQNIEGHITFDEVKKRLDSYYRSKPVGKDDGRRTEEADKVSARIAEILSERAFTFSMIGYTLMHKRLFEGIYTFAGNIRDYDITKSEWVLNGATVHYAGADNIRTLLWQEFEQEKEFAYKGMTQKQIAEHIARFISAIWKIHAFGEGNTRTTAVFAIKYLRDLGYDVTNDMFAEHSWYFRNALVRANYNNLSKGIHSTNEYLNRFFGNLMLGENNTLKNREMHVLAHRLEHPPIPAAGRAEASDSLTATELKVFNVISEGELFTACEIAVAVGVTDRTVKKIVSVLVERGLIKRVGSRRSGRWVRL